MMPAGTETTSKWKPNMSDIENTLLGLLNQHVGRDTELNMTSDFVSGLGLESVQVMEFVMEVEEHFDIAIDLDALSGVRSVRDLAAVVAKARGAAA